MNWIKKLWYNEGRPQPISILDLWRIVLHFPVGCFIGWVILQSPVVGVVLAVGFLTYEVVEDWRIADRGYKDIFGFLFGIGAIFIFIGR